tara:strand:+ start:279 stop:851 length:573 start_codon:yes stop_codon:yes gene_type:complete
MKILGLLFSTIISIVSVAGEYTIDPAHSHVGFKVRYMMLGSVYGQFNQFQGQVILTDGILSEINGQIDVASIDTNNIKRDAHLRSDDFFNANNYPNITFKTTQVAKNEVGYTAIGELEIHGIKNKVSIPFTLTDKIVDVYGNERMGLSGQLKINRKEYGIMYSKKMDNGGLVVDDYVDIELNVQVVKKSS